MKSRSSLRSSRALLLAGPLVVLVAGLAFASSRLASSSRKEQSAPSTVAAVTPRSSNRGFRHVPPSRYALTVGSEAPDFTLGDATGTKTVRLSDRRGKPVVLLFGSHSCPFFCTSMDPVKRLIKKYGGRAEFYLIYTMEEHPTIDGRSSEAPGVARVEMPRNLEERRRNARRFASLYHIKAPVLVDGMDNGRAIDYDSLPDRVFVIDAQGKIAFAGGIGPWDYHPAEAAPVLDRLLSGKQSAGAAGDSAKPGAGGA